MHMLLDTIDDEQYLSQTRWFTNAPVGGLGNGLKLHESMPALALCGSIAVSNCYVVSGPVQEDRSMDMRGVCRLPCQ